MTHTESELKIYKTTDYSQFKLIESNRPINPKWVIQIAISINTIGFIKGRPVLVDKDMRIIDGQHTFDACRVLGLPIYYMIIEDNPLETMIHLNSMGHKWGMVNYVEHWAGEGKEDYIRLVEFSKTHKISMHLAYNIFARAARTRKYAAYKQGNSFTQNPKADEVMQLLREAKPYCPYCYKMAFVRAAVAITSKISEKKLLKLRKNLFMIHEQPTTQAYLRLFEGILLS